jgi:hypothetical protein
MPADFLEELAQVCPNWQYQPPAHLAKPFIRVGAVLFDSSTPTPEPGKDVVLCHIKAGMGECMVLHHMELQASIMLASVLERLAPESAHGMLHWNIRSDGFLEEPYFATGGQREEVDAAGIALFRSFSVEEGTMAPVVVRPGCHLELVLNHTHPGGFGGLLPVPENSKISGVLSGVRVTCKSVLSAAVQPRPGLERAPRPSTRPHVRPGWRRA